MSEDQIHGEDYLFDCSTCDIYELESKVRNLALPYNALTPSLIYSLIYCLNQGWFELWSSSGVPLLE